MNEVSLYIMYSQQKDTQQIRKMYLVSERKKQPTPVKEVEKRDEEEWPLKDVVFVEDVKTVPVGKVLKVSTLKQEKAGVS